MQDSCNPDFPDQCYLLLAAQLHVFTSPTSCTLKVRGPSKKGWAFFVICDLPLSGVDNFYSLFHS